MQLFYLKNYLYCPAKDIKAFRPPFLERAAGSRGSALAGSWGSALLLNKSWAFPSDNCRQLREIFKSL